MKLFFSNVIFDVEDLLKGKINQKTIAEQDRYVLNFVKEWETDKASYQFNTSGSTGRPQTINLSKKQLSYSARQTINYLFKKYSPRRLMLCLDPRFIGGTQVITRALLTNSDLIIVPPTSNPLLDLNEPVDLVSFVPLQVETILQNSPEKFTLVRHALIGGAELKFNLIEQLIDIKSTKFYQTYGMTETASHVAIKLINEDLYKPLGDIELGLDIRGCLRLKGTVTNLEWIQTNDIVELQNGGFKWIGRADWVINSGGVKISPENVERKINKRWPDLEVAITSLPDDRFGEKLVLIVKKPFLKTLQTSSVLTKFEIPKEELVIKHFPKNEGGKLDRKEIQQWARNQ